MPVLTESLRLKALKSAPMNSWIALSSDETSIVATGNSYEEVSRKINASGLSDLVVLKTPASWASFSV
jgi:hypothetical protein